VSQRAKTELLAFNRGIISKLGLARVDLQRMALSAETQTNFMPRILGSMMLRPGLGFKGRTHGDGDSIFIPFVFAVDDTALVEVAGDHLRVWVDESPVVRGAVSTVVANGNFTSNLNNWSDDDESGATSVHVAGGYMGLTGTGFNAAARTQEVTVAAGDQNKEHALRIEVFRGPVNVTVGQSAGTDEYVRRTTLGTGTHSLAFTPSGNFFIRFTNTSQSAALVASCNVESSGDLSLPFPSMTLAERRLIRWDQSGDVIFLALPGRQQRRIERRAARSWSVVLYEPENGPFRVENLGPIRISASALTGDITLSASRALFRPGHVGALFRISSIGQRIEAALTGEGQETGHIRVTGVGTTRAFTITRSGTWTANLTLQRSIGEPGAWVDVLTNTSNGSGPYNDGLDNQIVYYRYAIKTGGYTSGTANIVLEYSSGSITGTVRIRSVSSTTSAVASVIVPLGGTGASGIWSEGAWSDHRGWPSAVAIYESRLWWAGKDKIWGSITDAFESFDPLVEGDSGPVSRSIGSGPVDRINWLMPLQRLFIGCQGAEKSARSSSFDEPLTPTNFNLKDASTQGAAPVPPVRIDSGGAFVQRNRRRLYEITYSPETFDYVSQDLTGLVPDLLAAGVVRIAVQRQPDTRIHCVRDDGSVAVLVFDRLENVVCWIEVETDGAVHDVIVMPGDEEDAVYYVTQRGAFRCLERWAMESECQGGLMNKQADSFVTYDGPPTTTIAGLDHLEGETVVCWADGADRGTFTVSGGAITLPVAVSKACAGLGYTARYKSRRLVEGTGIGQRKRVDHLGLILSNTHAQGLRYGPSFDALDDLPLVERYEAVDAASVREMYDEDSVEFPGEWSTDSRICLEAAAPRPCTVLYASATFLASQKE
jgi:hypothetical protein